MQFFTMRKRASGMALAIALATGSAVVATAVYPADAHAQRSKKKKKGSAEYSKEFIAAYTPVEAAVNGEAFDLAANKAQIDQLVALVASDDEKIATGQVLLNAGIKGSDQNLQLQGVEMMIDSNKIAAEDLPRFMFNGYILANNTKDYGKARDYLKRSIDLGYSSETVTKDAMQITLAELYWTEGMNREGISYIQSAMDERKSLGLPIDERWYGRAITVAYQNEVQPELWNLLAARNAEFPTAQNWRDWMNRIRNMAELTDPQTLDLLRFGREVGALEDKIEYLRYVEVVDARRLPQEAKNVIEEAYASGIVSRDDIYVSDNLDIANARIAADRDDLPALERDAAAAGAQLRTVAAAANAFYSYGEYAKAAKFFEKALTMPGVETAEALTRLGMAQTKLGQYDEAQATFAKVQGNHAVIAALWSAYVDTKTAPAAVDTTAQADVAAVAQ